MHQITGRRGRDRSECRELAANRSRGSSRKERSSSPVANGEATEAPNPGAGAQQLLVVVAAAAAAESGEQRVSRERPLAIRSFRGSRQAELDPGGCRETLEFGNREMRSGRTEGRGGGGGGWEARGRGFDREAEMEERQGERLWGE